MNIIQALITLYVLQVAYVLSMALDPKQKPMGYRLLIALLVPYVPYIFGTYGILQMIIKKNKKKK